MLIREYAERIYTSSDVAEKLLAPDRLEDLPAHQDAKWVGLAPPGRPPGLALDRDLEKPRFTFPKLHELEDDTRRGHALHFFANHELLALELMALMLLRFPDADPVFRKTLVNTMRDEQRHLQLYLTRMEELGVGFGEIGVNAFFFNHIADVCSPRDFVARMSLTFEQANLDFSMFYAEAFKTIGDHETQAIMEEVLHDEIAHVAHGVRWFNEWREDGLSMWDAYRKELTFPLTPARAKGMDFFRAPRVKAGLPADFIDRLRVYNHSKGRTPDVWLFNPDAEDQCAHPGGDYAPNKRIAGMQQDLETLPMLLAKQDDVVLVSKLPNASYLNDLMDLGFAIPEFVVADTSHPRLTKRHELVGRHCGTLRPWGWSPRVRKFLAPLSAENVAPWLDTPNSQDALFSKAWFAERYERLTQDLPFVETCLLEPPPESVTTMEEAQATIARLFENGFPMVVLKSPFGTSGRRNMRLRPDEPNTRQRAWIQRTLDVQKAIVVEGFFEKAADLSFQFDVVAGAPCRMRGVTRPMTDHSGRFRGIFVTRPLKDLEPDLRHFAFRGAGDSKWLEKCFTELARRCGSELEAHGYEGPAGFDAMIVRHDGQLKLRPLVEVNVRWTMGRIALALSERTAPGASGIWCILGPNDLKKGSTHELSGILSALQSELPLNLLHGARPKVRQGVIATNSPTESKNVLSLLIVAESKTHIADALTKVGLGGMLSL
jgi:uncharacterized ferritin-like protein (DUF455 family)